MKEFPLDIFPDSFFPDVELESVALFPDSLRVEVSDGEWGMQSDLIPFWGAGTMTFAYTGPAQIRWRVSEADAWHYENSMDILQSLSSFEMVSVLEGRRVFRFRTVNGNILEIILQELTKITWSGDGYDDDDDGQ